MRALRHPALARVLAALHERPAEPWTVESLAREVHVSCATLARRFAGVVGEPPLTYLARWRMHLAAQRLKYSTDTVGAIAREVGYTSEYAFNRAFARHRGQPPGRYRRLASTGHQAPGDAGHIGRTEDRADQLAHPLEVLAPGAPRLRRAWSRAHHLGESAALETSGRRVAEALREGHDHGGQHRLRGGAGDHPALDGPLRHLHVRRHPLQRRHDRAAAGDVHVRGHAARLARRLAPLSPYRAARGRGRPARPAPSRPSWRRGTKPTAPGWSRRPSLCSTGTITPRSPRRRRAGDRGR
ncbi:MAG TPA: AraC family transcriptional regulator [Candidatus Dormibacteraeota bacterium]|nr:AraC family transcriptional regulator [Candidatus Dormibacteraeota bacterium]